MTVTRGVKTLIDNFDRPLTLTTTPEGGTGWTISDTSAAGAPTYATITENGGALEMKLAADSEAEIISAFHNDILMFDLADLHHIWAVCKVAAVDAVTVVTFGVGSARNDDEDLVATNAYLKIEGATSTSNLVAETDDGSTDNNDKATGATLGSDYKKLLIDFTQGLSDVRFYVDGDRVASGTTFDMSGVTAGQNVQPILQVEKASGTAQVALTIAQFGIQYSYGYGV